MFWGPGHKGNDFNVVLQGFGPKVKAADVILGAWAQHLTRLCGSCRQVKAAGVILGEWIACDVVL